MAPSLPAHPHPSPPRKGGWRGGFLGLLTPAATVFRAAVLASQGSGYRVAAGRSPAPPVPLDTSPGRRQGTAHFREKARLVNRKCRKIEVIQVRGREPAAPAAAEAFPIRAEERPNFRSRDAGWLITHSQVSRQRGAAGVERTRGRRIKRALTSRTPVPTNDPEARPTQPLGGKLRGGLPIEPYQKRSQSRLQNPSSRQATRIVPDTIRRSHLGPAPPGKPPRSCRNEKR